MAIEKLSDSWRGIKKCCLEGIESFLQATAHRGHPLGIVFEDGYQLGHAIYSKLNEFYRPLGNPSKDALIFAIVLAESDSTRTTRTPTPAFSTWTMADLMASSRFFAVRSNSR